MLIFDKPFTIDFDWCCFCAHIQHGPTLQTLMPVLWDKAVNLSHMLATLNLCLFTKQGNIIIWCSYIILCTGFGSDDGDLSSLQSNGIMLHVYCVVSYFIMWNFKRLCLYCVMLVIAVYATISSYYDLFTRVLCCCLVSWKGIWAVKPDAAISTWDPA